MQGGNREGSDREHAVAAQPLDADNARVLESVPYAKIEPMSPSDRPLRPSWRCFRRPAAAI